MSRLGIGLIVVSSLALAALMAAALVTGVLGTKKGSWWLKSIFLEPRAYVITVDLTVEGERLSLTRKINCIPYLRWEGPAYFRAWQPAFLQFGERLKSGGAVIVTTPLGLCGPALEPDQPSKDLAIPDGHIPYIRWVDNADKPRLVEGYFAKDYFSRPNARVHYNGMTARAVPYNPSYPAEDPFDWSFNNPSYWDNQDHLDMFPGFYAWPIAEQQWSQDETIAQHIRALDQPQVLPQSISSSLGRFSAFIDGSWFGGGRGTLPGPSLSGNYRSGYMVSRVGNHLPLLKTVNGFEIRDQERGYLAYYRIEQPKTWRKYQLPDVAVVFGGQTLSIKPRTLEEPSIYDPTKRIIYRISVDWMSYPVGHVE